METTQAYFKETEWSTEQSLDAPTKNSSVSTLASFGISKSLTNIFVQNMQSSLNFISEESFWWVWGQCCETWAGTLSFSSNLRTEEYKDALGNFAQENLTRLMQDCEW